MKRSTTFIPCHPQARPAQHIALGFSTQILIHSKLRTFLRRLLAVHQSQHLISRDQWYGIEDSRGSLPHNSMQYFYVFQKHIFSHCRKTQANARTCLFPLIFIFTYLVLLHWQVFNRISVISLISVPTQVSRSFMVYTISLFTAYAFTI